MDNLKTIHTRPEPPCTCHFYHGGQCPCPYVSLFIIDTNSNNAKPFLLPLPAPSTTFLYFLSNELQYSLDSKQNNFILKHLKKENGFTYCIEEDISTVYDNMPLHVVGLQLPIECLSQFKAQPRMLHNAGKTFLIARDRLPLHLRILLEEIVNCQESDPLRDVFLMHKKYELLYQQIKLLDSKSTHQSVSPSEHKAAHKVYDLLLQDIEKKPSLSMLASSVGITRSRLTELFRILFGDTVFGILRQKRLQCSRNLLADKDKNITEIAYLCGFSSPSHLTKAFAAEFGMSPKQYQLMLRNIHTSTTENKDTITSL